MPLISVDTIQADSKAALLAHGAQDWIADAVSKAVAAAESHGNVICGLYYLESYCLQLRTGRVKGDAVPVVTASRPGSIIVDAQFGFAQAAFEKALPDAIAAVKANGTASLAVAHAHTCTSLGYFTEQFARAGIMAIGLTNASPIVAPPGGKGRVIGTNPMAMSVPDGNGGLGMHFDFSTSAVALGKITMAKAAGETIPLGWAVDADGQPTTDPEAALGGSLVSAGGYKGWGFGLMAELLAAGMTGSVNSVDVKPLKAPEGAPHDLGQFYILFDPATHHDDFFARFDRVAQAVGEQEGARIPGQDRTPMTQVQVPDALWDLVQSLKS